MAGEINKLQEGPLIVPAVGLYIFLCSTASLTAKNCNTKTTCWPEFVTCHLAKLPDNYQIKYKREVKLSVNKVRVVADEKGATRDRLFKLDRSCRV